MKSPSSLSLNYQLPYGFLFLAFGLLVMFFTGASEPELPKTSDQEIVFRVLPRGTKVFKNAKVTTPLQRGEEPGDFLGESYTAISKSKLRDTRKKVTLIFRRDHCEPLTETFDDKQLQAMLQASDGHPAQGPPLKLKPLSIASAFKLRLQEGSWYLVGAFGSLVGFGFALSIQRRSAKRLKLLESLEAQADKDKFINTLVKGYRITERLGQGAFGKVYKAVPDEELGKPSAGKHAVAIKFFEPVRQDGVVEARKRFVREAETLRDINHPNIVAHVDHGVLENQETGSKLYFMILEFVPGPTLDDMIFDESKAGDKDGELNLGYVQFNPRKTWELLHPVAKALQYLHENKKVHRDVKPENIKIAGDKPMLLDLGMVKTEDSKLTMSGVGLGTQLFAPKESYMGKKSDGRADQYALGVIAFMMIGGCYPFGERELMIGQRVITGDHLKLVELNEDCTPEIAQIVEKMIAVERDDRFDSILEAFNAFEKALG